MSGSYDHAKLGINLTAKYLNMFSARIMSFWPYKLWILIMVLVYLGSVFVLCCQSSAFLNVVTNTTVKMFLFNTSQYTPWLSNYSLHQKLLPAWWASQTIASSMI